MKLINGTNKILTFEVGNNLIDESEATIILKKNESEEIGNWENCRVIINDK